MAVRQASPMAPRPDRMTLVEYGPGGYLRETSALFIVLGVAFAFGLYFALRYGGYWAEVDSARFANAITGMQAAGSINYPGAYIHGFGYPMWAATLSWFVGVPVSELLRYVTPVLGSCLLGVFAFASFRRWLGSDKLGLIAACTLFLVPELVFTVSRGNHEKLTVALTLLASLALLQSFVGLFQRRWRIFAGWVAVYYVVAFSLTALNVFFGSSFIVASTLVFLFGSLLSRFQRGEAGILSGVSRRLLLLVSASWLLVILMMWWIYPQAGSVLFLLTSALERLSVLFLAFGVESNPYSVTESDWVNPQIYQMISSFRWILLVGSFVAWLFLVRQAFTRLSTMPLQQLLLLALYAAFAGQLALGIPIDLLNLAAGSNLQVRLYTYFVLFAAPVAVLGLAALLDWLGSRVPRPLLTGLAAVAVLFFSLMSLFKSTLDPLVANRWIFYHPSELQAVRFWINDNPDQPLWVGTSGRLAFAYLMHYAEEELNEEIVDIGDPKPSTNKFLNTRIEEASAAAWNHPLPTGLLGHRVYDNGEAQIHHRLPRTPFQQ